MTHIEAAGQRLHYLEAGQGKALFLLHGNPGSGRVWSKVISTLADPVAYAKALKDAGAELIDDPENPGTKTIKFRVPGGGGIGEIGPPGLHERKSSNA